jgi:DNA-binding NarL/FixJ family response regulator
VINVLLADDHLLVRSGLESLLNAHPDLCVVASAADGAEAVALAAKHAPDVVLMDLSMPVLDGVAATRQIVSAQPQTQVIVLTSFADRERVVDALDAGAIAYLLKDSDPTELVEAVRSVMRGESPLDPRIARTLLHARQERTSPQLSDREREVLSLVGEGLANKQIARRLGISERTVKAHLTNVFQRIGVRDRTSAALWAKRNLPAE